LQKTRPVKRSSTSSMSNSNISNAHTISITVKGLTVFMTEYEVSDCSSSTTTNIQVKRNAVSSASDNVNTNGHSENESDHNDGTLDDVPSKIEDTDGSVQLNSDDDDDEDYLKKSSSKKIATSSSRRFWKQHNDF